MFSLLYNKVFLIKKYFFGKIIYIHVMFVHISMIKMNGWIAFDFTSFSTVFQSYEHIGQVIMKGCVQWKPIYN